MMSLRARGYLEVEGQTETMSSKKPTLDAELEKLQHESFYYFLDETNPANGLVIDKTEADWSGSTAAAVPNRAERDPV